MLVIKVCIRYDRNSSKERAIMKLLESKACEKLQLHILQYDSAILWLQSDITGKMKVTRDNIAWAGIRRL